MNGLKLRTFKRWFEENTRDKDEVSLKKKRAPTRMDSRPKKKARITGKRVRWTNEHKFEFLQQYDEALKANKFLTTNAFCEDFPHLEPSTLQNWMTPTQRSIISMDVTVPYLRH